MFSPRRTLHRSPGENNMERQFETKIVVGSDLAQF